MGRKKKIKNDEVNLQTNENIQYKSKVTVELVKNNGKVLKTFTKHNTAQTPLFSFLVNCLANNYLTDLCPEYVYLLFSNSTADTVPVYVGKQQSVITRKSVSGNSILTYTVIISANKTEIPENKPYCGLAFFNKEAALDLPTNGTFKWDDFKNSASMYVLFDSSNFGSPDNNLLINWQVTFVDGGLI